jgi:GTP cyclohydrolase II
MHLPAASIRTQVMLPRRFADGFGTTARVYTFDGLADCPGAPRDHRRW